MKAFFRSGELRQVDVNGNVLVIFYPVEEQDSSLIMHNYTEGSFLRMLLKNRKMEQGTFIGKTTGVATPLDQIPADKFRLKSFAWFDYIRPLDKADIFNYRGKKESEKLQKIDRGPVVSPPRPAHQAKGEMTRLMGFYSRALRHGASTTPIYM